MTREELRDYVDEQRTLDNIPYHVYSALIDGIDTLEEEPKWIPVSENLPEENITVLGTTKFDDIYKTELYDDCGEKKWYANGNFDVPIVAWMPKPKTYEESEKTE